MGACEVGVWVHVKRVCKCTGLGKKNKSEKNNQKKKSEKWTHWFKSPQKHQLLLVLHVLYVCVASVRAGREVCGGGIYRDGIRQVFIGTLQWHGCFSFWA